MSPKVGISFLEWSFDGSFISSKEDSFPNLVWIWEIKKLKLNSILIHNQEVRSMKWNPLQNQIAFCTGIQKINLWSIEGCCSVIVPEDNFIVQNLKWNYNGKCLLLCDHSNFICSFV